MNDDISNSWLYVASAVFVIIAWFVFVVSFTSANQTIPKKCIVDLNTL